MSDDSNFDLRAELSAKEDKFTEEELRIQAYAFAEIGPYMPLFAYEIKNILKDGPRLEKATSEWRDHFKLNSGCKIYGGCAGVAALSMDSLQVSMLLLALKTDEEGRDIPETLDRRVAQNLKWQRTYFYVPSTWHSFLDYLDKLYKKLTAGK